jgi:hypothetical protein
MAKDVDASDDQAIRDYLSSASAFFDGTSVSTNAYAVQREYPGRQDVTELGRLPRPDNSMNSHTSQLSHA